MKTQPMLALVAACAIFSAGIQTISAQVPNLLNYQGRVMANGTNFNGSGQFKFALVSNGGSATYWSNDGSSTGGSEPSAAVTLNVSNGLYSTLLGDTNMTAVPAGVFTNASVFLRVWFNDGASGFQLMSPDARIGSAGYAIMAGSVVDGAITSAKITSGAVTPDKLAETYLTTNAAAATYQPLGNVALLNGSPTFSGTVSAANFSGSGAGLFNVPVTSLVGIANFQIVAWGNNSAGQINVPPGLTNATALAAGAANSVALKSDGTVVAWGDDRYGVNSVPASLTNATAIAAGRFHSLALKSDGTVVAWGDDSLGVNTTNVPAGLANVTAIAAGGYHGLALKSNGTVVAWGYNGDGETNVPAGLANVTAIACGGYHSLALKSNGTVAAWGENVLGQTTVPAGLTNVIAVAAGEEHSLALKSDGTVVAWGDNSSGQTTVPAGLTNVIALAAGPSHSLALKRDGTVVAWGGNSYGQTDVPAGLTNVITLALGSYADDVLVIVRTFAPSVALLNADNTFNGNIQVNGTISGDGSGVTNLNASQLGGGTLADARLSANVALLNANNIFTGSNTIAGSFAGNGVNLTNIPLSGLQVVPVTNNQSGVSLTGTFTGNGNALTNLNATNLTGNMADARLSANVALLNNTNVFTATNRFAGVAIITNGNNSIGGTFTGNGANLTNIPLSGLQAIPVTNNQSGLSLNGTFTGNGVNLTNISLSGLQVAPVTNNQSGVSLSGTFTGNGVNLTNIPLSGLQVVPVTNNQSGVSLTGTFTGNGNPLTNLNATNLTGTIADARLSTNVAMLNDTNVFTATNRFAGVAIITNGNNTIGGSFTGNGANLTNIPLSGLQAIPVTNNQSGLSLNGTFTGNGVNLTNIPLSGLQVIPLTNNQSGVSLTGTFTGNGVNLTNIPLSGLQVVPVTNNQSGLSLTGTFTGNGGSLTNLSAGQLSGTISSGNISSGLITSNMLADGSITLPKIVSTAISSGSFTNPSPSATETFGTSMAVMGTDRVLIGAPHQQVGVVSGGAVFLYNTSGTLLTTFTKPSPSSGENFGGAVAVVGSDKVLVGAQFDSSNLGGAAYLYNTNGTLLRTFADPTPQSGAYFGVAVAAFGTDKMLVGATHQHVGGTDAGSAYLFSTNGTLVTTFNDPATVTVNDAFGISLAAVGTSNVLIGAWGRNLGGTDSGAAYLFSTNGTLLVTFANPAPTVNLSFGVSVATVGTSTVLIGAPSGGTSAGTAYLFNTNGTLITTFSKPSPANLFDFFGTSVAAVGTDKVLITAPGDSLSVSTAGAAYLFNTNGNLLQSLRKTTPVTGDNFGVSVAAVGSSQYLVGASQDNTGASQAGAVYLFSSDGSSYIPGLVGDGVVDGSITTSSFAAGAITDSLLSTNVALLNANNTFTGTNTVSGTFSGDGSNLTNLTPANINGTLNANQIPNLGASKITGGNLNDARLSANVPLLNANNTFTGTNTISGTFTGDGSGLTNTTTAANFISAYSTNTQPVTTANTFQDITNFTLAQSDGWTYTTGSSAFTNAQTGLYLIQYTANVTATSTTDTVTIIAGLSNTEIAGSQSAIEITSANSTRQINRSFIASFSGNQKLKFRLSATTGGSVCSLAPPTAGGGTTKPSFSVTVTRIQ